MPKRPTVQLICDYTGETFEKDKREYNRQVRKGRTRFYKDRETAGLATGKRQLKPLVQRQCAHCQKAFEVRAKAKSTHFCSRGCQSRYVHEGLKADPVRFEQLKKCASDATKQAWIDGKLNHSQNLRRPVSQFESRECPVCLKPFRCKTHSRQRTCKATECVRELMRRNSRANPNCGGETNYKRYRYKDVTMDSAWEVEIAQWMDSHQVQWKRSRTMMFHWTDEAGAKRRYYPDFYLPECGVYLDPKNKYLMEKDRYKILAVQRENGITIIWGLRETLFVYLEAVVKPTEPFQVSPPPV